MTYLEAKKKGERVYELECDYPNFSPNLPEINLTAIQIGKKVYVYNHEKKSIPTAIIPLKLFSDENFTVYFGESKTKRIYSFPVKNSEKRMIYHDSQLLAIAANSYLEPQANESDFTLFSKENIMQLFRYNSYAYQFQNYTKEHNIVTKNIKSYSNGELIYFDKKTNQAITISNAEKSNDITHFEDGMDSWSYKYNGRAVKNDKDNIHVALVRNCYEVIKFSAVENIQGSVGRKTSSGELDILSALDIKAKNARSYSRSYWAYQDSNDKWHLMNENNYLRKKVVVFDYTQYSKEQLKKLGNKMIFEKTDKVGAEEIYALENNSFMLEYKDRIDIVLTTGEIINLNKILGQIKISSMDGEEVLFSFNEGKSTKSFSLDTLHAIIHENLNSKVTKYNHANHENLQPSLFDNISIISGQNTTDTSDEIAPSTKQYALF